MPHLKELIKVLLKFLEQFIVMVIIISKVDDFQIIIDELEEESRIYRNGNQTVCETQYGTKIILKWK